METFSIVGAVAGVICLLFGQLAAVLASLAAYLRIRTKMEQQNQDRESSRAECMDMTLRLEAMARSIAESEKRNEKRAADAEEDYRAAKKAIGSLASIEERISSLESKWRKARAKKAAEARYAREDAEQTDLVEQSEADYGEPAEETETGAEPGTDSLGRPRL